MFRAPISRYGFKAAYNIEKVKNKIQAAGGVSDKSLGELATHFKTLNKEFPFTNSEIVGAALELFLAGRNLEQVYSTFSNTLSLAMAGDSGRSRRHACQRAYIHFACARQI